MIFTNQMEKTREHRQHTKLKTTHLSPTAQIKSTCFLRHLPEKTTIKWDNDPHLDCFSSTKSLVQSPI